MILFRNCKTYNHIIFNEFADDKRSEVRNDVCVCFCHLVNQRIRKVSSNDQILLNSKLFFLSAILFRLDCTTEALEGDLLLVNKYLTLSQMTNFRLF